MVLWLRPSALYSHRLTTVRPQRAQIVRSALMVVAASAVCGAQQLPPIRQLRPVEHASKELLGSVTQALALPEGRVLVHDIRRRRVVLFDSTLGSSTIIADATDATSNAYSGRSASLIRYAGDSSLLIDPSALTMTVIDGRGRTGRIMAVPSPRDAYRMMGGRDGTPGFDSNGRLVFLGAPKPVPMSAPPQDSAPLIAFDLRSRRADTLTKLLRQGGHLPVKVESPEFGALMFIPTDPLPLSDDWAVLADGSVAVVRSQDYHVDWFRPGLEVTATRKLPFAWMHLDDSTKSAFMDSVKAVVAAIEAERQRQRDAGVTPTATESPPGTPLLGLSLAESQRLADRVIKAPPQAFVSNSSLPDYAPPFAPGAVSSDMDGNLWVRTSIVVNGGSIYDVISSKGVLVDRVQVPARRVIAGFGRGGIVYMGVRDSDGVRLEQARWR